MTVRLKYTLLAVVFLLGYTSMSFELLVLRQLINFVGSNTLITSVVITFILLFLSVGYYIGSVVHFSGCPLRLFRCPAPVQGLSSGSCSRMPRVSGRSVRRIMESLAAVLVVWYIIACSYYLIEIYFYLLYASGVRSTLGFVFAFSAVFLAFPSVCLGFITSVIGRMLHRYDTDYTGRFMAVDTIGSVLGSMLTTLVLMPLIGVSATVVALVFLAAVAAFLLSSRRRRTETIVLSIMLLAFAFSVNSEKLMNPQSTLVKDDAVSRIEIEPADVEKGKALSEIMRINGSFSSKISVRKELMFDYVRFINETFIAPLPQDFPRDILVLGAGGFTIGLGDRFHNYTFLDIDKDLKNIAEQKFLQRPLPENQKFIAEDAYLFMLNARQKYDLIVVDVFSAVRSIPMNFVTADFFRMVKERLKPNGIMVANVITSPSFGNDFSRGLDNTLRQVFPQYLDRRVLQPYNPYGRDLANVEYVYYNYPPDKTVYTQDKNASFYGQW